MAARTGNPILDVLLLVGGYYVFTHPSTGLDAEAALAYQEGVLIPSRKSKDIAKLQQLLKTAQATGQTAAATTIQAYLTKLGGGSGGGSAGSPSSKGKAPGTSPAKTTYTPAALGSCTHQTLRVGSAGPCVAALQNRLNVLMNAGLPTGGHFEGNLEAAVKAFQRQEGIAVDGIVGPQTWARLVSPKGIPGSFPGPLGRYGIPTARPGKVRVGASGCPDGWTSTTVLLGGVGNQKLELCIPQAPARWPADRCTQCATWLGLGRAYRRGSPNGFAVLDGRYWGVAKYSDCRLVEQYVQTTQAVANHLFYSGECTNPLKHPQLIRG